MLDLISGNDLDAMHTAICPIIRDSGRNLKGTIAVTLIDTILIALNNTHINLHLPVILERRR